MEQLPLSLLFALVSTPIVLLVGYHVVLPRIVTIGYRQSLSSDSFTNADGSAGAGSVDIAYYTLYYDVRENDLYVSGKAPSARHWQLGAFDGATRLVDGAYLNQKTAVLDAEGHFRVAVTSKPLTEQPQGGDTTLFDCSGTPRGLMIFRVVLPEKTIEPPDVRIV